MIFKRDKIIENTYKLFKMNISFTPVTSDHMKPGGSSVDVLYTQTVFEGVKGFLIEV